MRRDLDGARWRHKKGVRGGGSVTTPFAIQLATELSPSGAGNWLPLLTLPFGLYLVWRFRSATSGNDFNMLLIQTAKLQFAFSALLALGLIALGLEAPS